MRKKLLFIPVALFLLCWSFSRVIAKDALGITIRRAQNAAVGLTCTGPSGGFFGTGTIIRSDGIILTSSTVIPPGATGIRVFLTDGRVLSGHLITVDTSLELALARIDGTGFPCINLGSSKAISVGEPVFTLGNAYNNALQEGRVSVGAGILSGRYSLDNDIGHATYKGEVLETDAPLNPGSDGGALVDYNGSLVGVLSLDFSPIRLLGTAVPVDVLYPAIEKAVGTIQVIKPEEHGFLLKEVLDKYSKTTVALEVKRKEDIKSFINPFMPRHGNKNKSVDTVPGLLSRAKGPVTGVCISKEGLIITSWYNIAGKLEGIKALDIKGKWRTCKILGSDTIDDTALLKADGGDWEASTLCDPKEIIAGKAVFVLGRSPDPKSLTITGGLLGVSRRNNARLFQHDAALNGGNSGGPVIDRNGNMLGIAVYVGHVWPEWSKNSGIGFGVRSDTLREILKTLKTGKNISWPKLPFLGVKQMGDRKKVIIDVVDDFPAQKGGLLSGDQVLKIGKFKISSWIELQKAVNTYNVGEAVEIIVLRKKEQKKFKIVLGERPRRL